MINKLAVIITTPPNNPLTQSAYQLIAQAVTQNIEVIGVFFYQAGVLNASQYLSIPNDEFPLHTKWQTLHKDHQVPLYLCSTAAEKHGLINENEPLTLNHINDNFPLAGLVELVALSPQENVMVQH